MLLPISFVLAICALGRSESRLFKTRNLMHDAPPLQADDTVFYPVTASWFRDRFSLKEWNATIGEFQRQGGDTVLLRAPPLLPRSKSDIMADPNFRWCGSAKGPVGLGQTHCVQEAEEELTGLGLKVQSWATYHYEENYSESIIACPKYERLINSSRVYYRLVFPLGNVRDTGCNYPSGTEVMVVFTSFAGIDPHELLIQAARSRNMSVYFGLPSPPPAIPKQGLRMPEEKRDSYSSSDGDANLAYIGFVNRVLAEHSKRYDELEQTFDILNFAAKKIDLKSLLRRSLTSTLIGYYASNEINLGQSPVILSTYLQKYTKLVTVVHSNKKKFVLSPTIDMNRSTSNSSVADHVKVFEILARSGVDVIAVQEGRGAGKGCYYYENQIDRPISVVDPKLDRIVRYLDPTVPKNVTFKHQFTASNQELFAALEDSRDKLQQGGTHFDLWLSVEAFEYLRDSPCIPLDRAGSGMDQLLDRTSKARMDRAIAVGGSHVQKIAAFAWDSGFLCTNAEYKSSLAAAIRANAGQPILTSCGWHSPQNMSIVVTGFSLLGLTQSYEVHWRDRDNKARTDQVYGYYVEGDYGHQHGKVDGLIYIQMWDVIGQLEQMKEHGFITIKAIPSNYDCTFSY